MISLRDEFVPMHVKKEKQEMSLNDPEEEPSLSRQLSPLGEKRVQSIRRVVRLSFGVLICIVVLILLSFIIASHF